MSDVHYIDCIRATLLQFRQEHDSVISKKSNKPTILYFVACMFILFKSVFEMCSCSDPSAINSMQFDALVAALPLSSEEDQLKRIQELQVCIWVAGYQTIRHCFKYGHQANPLLYFCNM